MAGEEPLLRATALNVTVESVEGPVPAVGPIDLVLRRNRVTALLGESGSGKSLLALALGWLAPPGVSLAGSVRLEDTELSTQTGRELARIRGRRIGFVLQEPETALDPVYTVGFQLREVLAIHRGLGRRDASRRAAAMLSDLGFDDPERILRAYPHELSGGQRQRIVIALALLPDPELLVADEPTASIDPILRARVLHRIARWREARRASILLVTHDAEIALRFADEVAVLYAGEIVERGPAADVLERPLHPYTRFLGGDRNALAAPDLPPPAPGRWESGCRLRPRCALARPECAASHPPLDGQDRAVRCPPVLGGETGP